MSSKLIAEQRRFYRNRPIYCSWDTGILTDKFESPKFNLASFEVDLHSTHELAEVLSTGFHLDTLVQETTRIGVPGVTSYVLLEGSGNICVHDSYNQTYMKMTVFDHLPLRVAVSSKLLLPHGTSPFPPLQSWLQRHQSNIVWQFYTRVIWRDWSYRGKLNEAAMLSYSYLKCTMQMFCGHYSALRSKSTTHSCAAWICMAVIGSCHRPKTLTPPLLYM